MTTYKQTSQRIDTNVVIKPPSNIEVAYLPNRGWYISINCVTVNDETNNRCTRYWGTAREATEWLIEHDLLVTKVYNEFDKAIKKSLK